MPRKTLILLALLVSFCSSSVARAELLLYFSFEQHQLVELIEDFSEETGIEVETRWYAQEQMLEVLHEALAEGKTPDMALVPNDFVGMHERLSLSELDPEHRAHELVTQSWDTANIDGAFYGAPIMRGNHLLLYYNKALVEEPGQDWQQIIRQSQSLAERSIDTIAWDYTEPYWLMPFVLGQGAEPLTEQGVDLNTPGMARALDFYKSLADRKLVDPRCDYDCAAERFMDQEVAYTINGDWAFARFSDQLGDQLGVAPLPRMGKDSLVSFYSTHLLIFPNNSLEGPKREELEAFIDYMQSPETQRALSKKLKVLPVEKKAHQHTYQNAGPRLQTMIQELDKSRPMPGELVISHIWDAIQKGLVRHRTGAVSGSQAAAIMQRQATRAQKQEPLTLVHTFGTEEQDFQFIDEFTRQTGIEVERRWIHQDEIKVELIEMVDKGIAPDMVLLPSDHVGLYRYMQYSQIDPDTIPHKISDDLWHTGSSGGRIYGLPLVQGNHLVLYYNKNHVSEPVSRWQELINQREAFERAGVEPITWHYKAMYWLMPFVATYGGMPMEETELTLNTPAMAKGLEFYKHLADTGLVDPECDYPCASDTFREGGAAYILNGDWALRDYRAALGDKLGVALLPTIGDNSMVSLYSTQVIAFPQNSLNGPQGPALKQFMRHALSPEAQTLIFDEFKVMPAEKTAVDYAREQADQQLQTVFTQLAKGRPLPSESAMSHAWGAIVRGFFRHQTGLVSGPEAASIMQRLAERELERENLENE